jgi:hypothetical protein
MGSQHALLCSLSLAACGGGHSVPPIDATAGDAAHAADAASVDAAPIDAAIDPTCATLAFATVPTRYNLPPGAAAHSFDQLIPEFRVCNSPGASRPAFGIIDLDADHRREVVVTSDCADPSVGTDHWVAFAGGATTGHPLALPPGYGAGAFTNLLEAGPFCGTGSVAHPAYTIADLTGDQVPDLVVTSACDDAAVGVSYWRVYAGGSAGFAPTAAAYALPSHGLEQAGLRSLFDLDGDGRVDLVGSQGSDPTLGTSRWLVAPGGASGFGGVVPFTLPPPNDLNAWVLVLPMTAGRLGRFDRAQRDVVKMSSTAVTVLRNTGTTLAAPGEAWPLPLATYGADAFAGLIDCVTTPQSVYAELLDVDGDARADLVIESRCADATVGAARWLVHRGVPGGFAAAAQPMALPAAVDGAWMLGLTQETVDHASAYGDFFPASYPASCPGGLTIHKFQLLDLVGSPAPDLVVSATCGDATVGTDHWLVYENLSTCP